MQQRAELFEMPEAGDMLFTLKDITYTPETPRLKEPFTVKGKIELFKIPFLAPIWVQARVTYPETWWEEIIPIIGSPTVAEGQMVIGGDFEVTFPRGFEREGEFLLDVEVYAGPTYSIDKITLPPFPPVASEETTFIVGGEVPPEEVGFREFRILSYSKNGGPPVTPSGVLELDIGDRCRVNVGFDHMDGEVTGEFHAAIWQKRPWDPHDEILHADKSFTVPSSPDWEPWEGYIDIPITSAISPGTEYGLYVKIMGITGGDIFTEYLANVITIKGIPAVGECRELKITSYDSVSPPSVLEVNPGDTIRVTSEFDYFGPATTGKLYSALWHPSWYDPHDEIAHDEKSITLPDSPEGNHITGYVDIRVPSGFAGTDFGLYTKVTGDLKDAMSPYYDNIIAIVGVPPTSDLYLPAPGFEATRGTYDLGDSVPWTMVYQYKGKAQGGWLTISLGTGIMPSFFTKHTFPRVAVSFEEAMDWAPGQLSGSFTLPTTLELGQMYNVRGKLETADGKQETDTDWAVFDITEVVPPASDLALPDPGFEATPGTYELGDSVPWTMVYRYKGKAQGGYLTISLGTGIAPSFFTKHTFPRVAVSFEEAMDWASGQLSGNFTLPTTLEPGQTYSVRAKLETADGVQETDTDWGVIGIPEVPPVELLQIVEIIAPQSAKAGELVTVEVTLINNYLYSFLAWPTAAANSVFLWFGKRKVVLAPSGTFTWYDTFVMPNHDAFVHVEAWAEGVFPETDTKNITITLEVVPPPSDLYLPAPGFEATPGTYDLGDSVPWTMVYQYKGKAQGGWLTISLGTGPLGTFWTKHTFARVAVNFEEAMDWAPGEFSGTFTLPTTLTPGQTYSVRAKLETADGVQETDTDWGVITIREVPVGITFQVSIWGIPAFGSYQKWWAYYWDPGINDFVDCGKWYYSYQKISFANVQSGGYLAVFLRRNSTVSPQYTSPTFEAVDGGSYTYDVEMGVIYG